jgi:hypothetical protein
MFNMKKGQASAVPAWVVTLLIVMGILVIVLIIIGMTNGALHNSWDKVGGTLSGSGLTG